MLSQYILQLQNKTLDGESARRMLDLMIHDDASVEQVAACVALLYLDGVSTEVFLGIVEGLRAKMKNVYVDEAVIDIVGTGGDGAQTINISTGSALLMASMGMRLAKHGNRATSSLCGSADVLEAMSIPIERTCDQVKQDIAKHGFGYCYCPLYHPAAMKLKDIRRALSVPSIFNLTGPLLNPVGAEYMLIGVYNKSIMSLYATVLSKLPIKKALVFHCAGTDELLPVDKVDAIEITAAGVQEIQLDAKDYGIKRCELSDLKGGKAEVNAKILLDVFSGEKGAVADTLIFNAAVGSYIYGQSDSIENGVQRATETLSSGRISELIKELRNG